jgi:hypothetical protein
MLEREQVLQMGLKLQNLVWAMQIRNWRKEKDRLRVWHRELQLQLPYHRRATFPIYAYSIVLQSSVCKRCPLALTQVLNVVVPVVADIFYVRISTFFLSQF